MAYIMLFLFVLGILEVFFRVSVRIIRYIYKDEEIREKELVFGVGSLCLIASTIYFVIKFYDLIIKWMT